VGRITEGIFCPILSSTGFTGSEKTWDRFVNPPVLLAQAAANRYHSQFNDTAPGHTMKGTQGHFPCWFPALCVA
jgi:hypothetical protein